jgi:hypothetical protein
MRRDMPNGAGAHLGLGHPRMIPGSRTPAMAEMRSGSPDAAGSCLARATHE